MNDVIESMAGHNPLLDIETSFNAYLTARTRSFKDHVVGGRLDYAFDADFSLRQKLNTFSGWSRIYKNLVTNEIPNKFKRIFQTTSIAGSLKYPEAYEAVKKCAERLQISVPTIYVRNAPNKYEIYSLSAENTEPAIVITSGLCDICTREELHFLIGCECGHIQNNHCIYYMAAPCFGIELGNDISNAVSNDSHAKQLGSTMAEWIRLSDVTADRAGIICCNTPANYSSIMDSIRKKGIKDYYAVSDIPFDYGRAMKMYETLHITPARHISLDNSWNYLERRVFAGMEFLNCEILYNWRTDIEKIDIHTVNKQALEVRCEIIIGAQGTKGGVN